jgi:hypothetical protein
MLERIKKEGLWTYITSEVRDWSPVHFAFDAFVTALIAYTFSLIVSIGWFQFVILSVLLFGTVVTGSVVVQDWRNRTRTRSESKEDLEFAQRRLVIHAIQAQLLLFVKAAPSHDSPEFMEWCETVAAYLTGVFKVEIEHEFGVIAARKNPQACSHYLIAISTKLVESDLRKTREDDAW